MEYEDLIEDKAEPPAEKPEVEDELEVLDPPAKSPWKAFILTAVSYTHLTLPTIYSV